MKQNIKILFDIVIIIVIASTSLFLYKEYWDDAKRALFGDEPVYTIYLGSKALEVTVADDSQERIQGLSGVTSLRDFEGKLFVFDTDDTYGIWMKDMLFPLDIIWIDKNLEVVYIEENVYPDTYPQVFTPTTEARFVLEVHAKFVSSVQVKVGDRLLLPPGILPSDIQKQLQK